MDLFDYQVDQTSGFRPLAERMRPRSLDEFIGQEHILGKGKLLRTLIETDNVQSMILQGPPATGKTSLSMIISKMTQAHFIKLNAVSMTIAELRNTIESATNNLKYYGKRTIVFIDEIHAMKSNIQMALLQAVESGTFILIGATTESVAHEIIPPLTSRCKIYTLNPLGPDEIAAIVSAALQDRERGLGDKNLTIEPTAMKYLADVCNGDVRSALNALEIAALSLPEGRSTVDLEVMQQAFQFRLNGITTTDFYDLISAFIKSMRGSQTDAALYWLARLLYSGVDPVYIARRIVIQAAEDVGLANPQALQVAIAAKEAVEFIGLPEAKIPLAEAVIYLSESPKSNSACRAISAAMEAVKNSFAAPVPTQLRNSTGQYVNPIDHPGTKLEYLPKKLGKMKFYQPQNSGVEERIFKKHQQPE